MKGIIIKKTTLFSVVLSDSRDFIMIKNIPNTSVGSSISLAGCKNSAISKALYYMIKIYNKIKAPTLSIALSVLSFSIFVFN